MNQNEYEKIVKSIIIPLSDELLNSKNNKLYNAIKIEKEFGDKLFNKINKLINYLKKNIVITDVIDRHKTAACLMCAIVDYSPFTIYKKGYNCEDLLFANELLAIYSAISILECYTPELKIKFPNTIYETRDVDSYIRTLCISLYTCKNSKQWKYSLLSYANILFLLEVWSCNNVNDLSQSNS